MLRQMLLRKTNTTSEKFSLRGKEVQRIESFSDGVFAFTVTLLVVSLEVPKTFSELLDTMHDFLAFAVGFSILISIWYWQYQFFRRFGLNDRITIFLNAALLFMVLFYAFPLKFLWKLLFDQLLGYDTNIRLPDNTVRPRVEEADAPWIMIIYGLGFIAINLVLALMHWHAYRKCEELKLSPLEKFDTVSVLQTYLLSGLVALISILVVVVGGNSAMSLSGFSYFLLPVFIPIYRKWRGGQRRKLAEAELSPAY